jgi:hypothetical protein
MISKAPELGDKLPEEWIREFLAWTQMLIFEFKRVKTSWHPAQGSDQHGTHPGKNLTAGTSAFIGMALPREINTVKQALLRVIPTGTGTIDYTANVSRGNNGEDESDGTSTLSETGVSVTDDQITEIDITSLFSSVKKDDQIGIELDLDAVSTTTDIYVLGLYFKFI